MDIDIYFKFTLTTKKYSKKNLLQPSEKNRNLLELIGSNTILNNKLVRKIILRKSNSVANRL